MKKKIPLREAYRIYNSFIIYIQHYCRRISIAGSARRLKPEVGDIEIVCEPKDPRLLRQHIFDLIHRGVLQPGPPNRGCIKPPLGPRYYRLIYNGYQIDLFAVYPPAEWGVILAIRTGPAEFSRFLMILAKKRGYTVRNGALWRGDIKIPTPTEESFFHALGMSYIPPNMRDSLNLNLNKNID